jgi:hypothetical protein
MAASSASSLFQNLRVGRSKLAKSRERQPPAPSQLPKSSEFENAGPRFVENGHVNSNGSSSGASSAATTTNATSSELTLGEAQKKKLILRILILIFYCIGI